MTLEPGASEDRWRAMLTGTDPSMPAMRRRHRMLPSDPRCKTCNAPFGGFGGWWMRRVGRGRWEKNPSFCRACYQFFSAIGVGGAEIEVSLLFADVRGSTTLAETMTPGAFSVIMNRFYELAAGTLIEHDAVVDKFVGDAAVGLFIPGMTGAAHAAQAIGAGRDMLARARHARADGSSLPIGVGVHTGIAYVGLVGSMGSELQFTALGDAVNTAARLASVAAAGEVLVSTAAADLAGLDTSTFEVRHLALKGRTEPVDAWVVSA
ncbi:MAG: adenylate/guanylate cyclase domain-containing protein [Chloroflexota bacterium]